VVILVEREETEATETEGRAVVALVVVEAAGEKKAR
jgi:hypothetical protein